MKYIYGKLPLQQHNLPSMTEFISFLSSGHSENTEEQCEVRDSTDSKNGIVIDGRIK